MTNIYLQVTYAIDVCSPAVAWHLNSAAAQLCQSGGFHRAKGTSDDMSDEARIKRTLFWTAYTYDKCLSLRLGYASTVRETDITVPREYGVAQLEEGCLPRLWLMTSSLRATTYERLLVYNHMPHRQAATDKPLDTALRPKASHLPRWAT